MIEAIAKEFIVLHIKEKNFNLENYEPKGQLIGFPKEIIARMLDYQEEQGNPRDISVFEKQFDADQDDKGFTWNETKEKFDFWEQVIHVKNFNLFFEKYPKQDNSQKFRIGDKVINIITNQIGIVKEVNKHKFDNDIDIIVDFGNNDICEYEINSDIIRPFLLHYRDDYNYDVIDFNNLPRRQEYKKWRAEVGGIYYFIKRDEHDFNLDKIYRSLDYYNSFSNELYKIGNYFQTREQAQEIVDQTNTYFQKIVKI